MLIELKWVWLDMYWMVLMLNWMSKIFPMHEDYVAFLNEGMILVLNMKPGFVFFNS